MFFRIILFSPVKDNPYAIFKNSVQTAKQAFQGHAIAQAEGKFITASRKFKPGDYKVDMNQPLANLILSVGTSVR